MDGEEGRVECTFLWHVENYANCCHKNGEALKSPYFTADKLEGTSWFVRVYRRGSGDADKDSLSLYLSRGRSGPETVSVNYELSVLAAEGPARPSNFRRATFHKGEGGGRPNFVNIERVPLGTLTVRCRIWRGEGTVRSAAHVSARTRIAVENVSFLHAVENFSGLRPNERRTLKIQPRSEKGLVVSSSLYFNDGGEMMMDVTPSHGNHHLFRRKTSLLGASGGVTACGDRDSRSNAAGKDIRKLPLSLTRREIVAMHSEYLPEDRLTLLCECVFSAGLEFEKIDETRHEMPRAAANPPLNQIGDHPVEKSHACPSISDDMKALYVNRRLTDVELETETRSFRAHRAVLCARSPVFAAMVAEGKTDRVRVDDLRDDVLQQLLLFLYSDDVGDLRFSTATELYCAADKYQIGKLKNVCSFYLVGNLTPTNASELLVLADTHGDGGLRRRVEEFILAHEREVFGSKEWETLMEAHPLLAMRTMHLKYKR